MLSELTSSGKELLDQNETISVTIANRFQVLDKFNDENLSNTTGCQRIAEVKRVTHGKTEYEEVKERFYEEKRKVTELEKRLQDRENSISELRVQYQTMKEQNLKLEDELQRIKTQLTSKGNNQESQKPKEQQNLETQKDNHKPKISIAGDSIVKSLHGWMMSRNKSVKVSCLPRATTQDIVSYLEPLINRKPDHLLIHIGANVHFKHGFATRNRREYCCTGKTSD